MLQIEVSLSQSHTNTPLNKIIVNFKWTSIRLGELKIANTFWPPNGSPVQVRIVPVDNQPTVVVFPITASTGQFANLFLTLTIASRNLATPILETTENQRLADLLAYMKTKLGTYTGMSMINLSHKTCNLYDLDFRL